MLNPRSQEMLGQINGLLQTSPFLEIRTLKAHQDGELFRLHGKVRSFYLKQLAQETVRRAARGIGLINEVSVRRS